MKMIRPGSLIVISAGSGAGKSTLSQQLLRRRKNLRFSISATTRLPRPGEKDGRDYFFLTEAAFKAMRARNELLEWAKVHDYFYGTPRPFVERTLAAGHDVILDVDVQGALTIKKLFPQAVLIFITAPTFKEMERRLRARSSENEAAIQTRLADARHELKFLSHYDYHVVNDRVPHAVQGLDAILTAESMRLRKAGTCEF
jgi:guanylate kinase